MRDVVQVEASNVEVLMSITRKIRLLALAAALAATNACVVAVHPRPGVLYVREGPPPVRVERVVAAPGPGFAWIAGFWVWRASTFVWTPGRWERVPAGHRSWVPGKWHHDRYGWYWVEGHWR
jgi:WXXGXW repeat (2 copies)